MKGCYVNVIRSFLNQLNNAKHVSFVNETWLYDIAPCTIKCHIWSIFSTMMVQKKNRDSLCSSSHAHVLLCLHLQQMWVGGSIFVAHPPF